jgi:hypothetical protein
MAVCYVCLPPREAFSRIEQGLTERFFSAELISSHVTRVSGGESEIGVFEKYSWRNGNRMTMTVLCSPHGKGGCEVYYVAAGAGGGFFGLFDDGGAANSFEHSLLKSLEAVLAKEENE